MKDALKTLWKKMMRRYAINDMGLLYYFLSIKVYQDDGVVFIC
jgi:hypothetical protein